jgi:hypothetical protein
MKMMVAVPMLLVVMRMMEPVSVAVYMGMWMCMGMRVEIGRSVPPLSIALQQ